MRKEKCNIVQKTILFCCCTLFILLIFSSCKKNGEVESNDMVEELGYNCTGFFVKTDSDFFLVIDTDLDPFLMNEVVKIIPKDETVSFKDLSTGDKIGVKWEYVGDSDPRIMPVFSIFFLQGGDNSNIDKSAMLKLEELGYTVE